MTGKARPQEWYKAIKAFGEPYDVSTVVARPNESNTPISWERFSYIFGNPFNAQPAGREAEMYAFAQGYAGSAVNNFHPTLLIGALFSRESRDTVRKINEAFRKGRAAKKSSQPPLETVVRS